MTWRHGRHDHKGGSKWGNPRAPKSLTSVWAIFTGEAHSSSFLFLRPSPLKKTHRSKHHQTEKWNLFVSLAENFYHQCTHKCSELLMSCAHWCMFLGTLPRVLNRPSRGHSSKQWALFPSVAIAERQLRSSNAVHTYYVAEGTMQNTNSILSANLLISILWRSFGSTESCSKQRAERHHLN